MRWNSEELLSKKDQDKAWMGTIDLVPSGGFVASNRGKSHSLMDSYLQIRQSLFSTGFSEVALPLELEERLLSNAVGPEEKLLASDSYSLASRKRAVRSDDNLLSKAQAIAPTFNEERLEKMRDLVESYSRNVFSRSELLSLAVETCGVRMEQASRLIGLVLADSLVQEDLLLRSCLITGWPDTVRALLSREKAPLQLFAFGPVSRAGLRPMGLWALSGAIVSELISPEEGAALVQKVFTAVALSFDKSSATSRLFIPGTESTISTEKRVIGRCGMLSPLLLSAFGVELPVFAFELDLPEVGVELGLAEKGGDIMYPQFFSDWAMTDSEIAAALTVARVPTGWGIELSSKIIKTCDLYYNQPAPCEFKLTEKDFGDEKVEVWLASLGTKLCGSDYSNELFVVDGNIVSSPASPPDDTLLQDAVARGTKTHLSIIKGFADLAGAAIESDPTKVMRLELGEFKRLGDVNLAVPDLVMNYATSKGREIRVRGILGLAVETRVKNLWRHEQPR